MDSGRTIQWTRPKLRQFTLLLNRAETEGKESITFEGKQVLVSYGKYLAEYVDGELRRLGA